MALWDIITGLVKEGITVLLTTQYLEEADRLADYIAVIDHGHIIEAGTSKYLKECCGGNVLVQIRLTDRTQSTAAGEVLSTFGDGKLQVDEKTGHSACQWWTARPFCRSWCAVLMRGESRSTT